VSNIWNRKNRNRP